MSVNEEFLDKLKKVIVETDTVIEIEKGHNSQVLIPQYYVDRLADRLLQHFQQEQESKTLKQGFYAGQANAGIKLDECHKNWKEWSGYMLRKVKQQDSNKSG